MADATDEKTDDAEGAEAWVTVQLYPPGPGCMWAAFVVPEGAGFRAETARVTYCALQHLSFEEDGAEELESRIVPVVAHATGEFLYLDGGRAGGEDHGFAGVANSEPEAKRIGEAVAAELGRQRKAAK